MSHGASIGIADHGGWAVLVTADREGAAPVPTDPALEAEAEGAAAVLAVLSFWIAI